MRHAFGVQVALPSEPCDPRDAAIVRMTVEIEELRTALGIALDRLRKAAELTRGLNEVTTGYM